MRSPERGRGDSIRILNRENRARGDYEHELELEDREMKRGVVLAYVVVWWSYFCPTGIFTNY